MSITTKYTIFMLKIMCFFMFHVKHGCEIMIYGDVIQKLIMNESIIDDNKLNLAFYKLTE